MSSSSQDHTPRQAMSPMLSGHVIVMVDERGGMRVHLVGLHYAPEPSGNAPYTTALARGLAERGHKVRVTTGVPHYPDWVVPPEFKRWRFRSQEDGVDVLRLRHFVPRHPTMLTRAAMEMSFGGRVLADRGREGAGPEVLICVSPALLASAIVVGRERLRAGGPALGLWLQDVYSSGLEELHGQSRMASAISKVEGRTLRAVDGVAIAHERFRTRLTGQFGLPSEAIEVIRNWTHVRQHDPRPVAETRARFGWGSEIVVLHAGNMGVKQGLMNVIEAAKIADHRGSRVRFVLVGGGNQAAMLHAAAVGVHRIQFIPSLGQQEFESVLSAADILLVNELPGVAEMSVPSKLTSYFVSGRPVLAATAPGSVTASEIEASRAGQVVISGSPSALLEAAEGLASDPQRAIELGRQGVRFAREHLTEGAALDHFERWMTALVAIQGRGTPPREER